MSVYFSGMILYYSKIVYLTSWMIVPPVRNWFGTVRNFYESKVTHTEPNNIVPKSCTAVPFRTGTVIWFGTIIHA